MKDKLFKNAIEIRKSAVQGYGVFATQNIEASATLEECSVLTLEENYPATLANRVFIFTDTEGKRTITLPLGYGCLYNHAETRNAYYALDKLNNLIIFTAEKPIKANEEIFISYTEEQLETRGINLIQANSVSNKKLFNIAKKLIFIAFAVLVLKLYLNFHF